MAVKAKFASGVPAPHNQQRPVKRDAECRACGKKGHFRRECRSTRRKDGGPLRPPPPRKAAGNLEEGDGEDREKAAEINVETLELNALSLAGPD